MTTLITAAKETMEIAESLQFGIILKLIALLEIVMLALYGPTSLVG